MPHELEQMKDGSASFAYADSVGSAWHNLGVAMDGLSDVDSILAAARADYEVQKAPLLAADPFNDEGHIDTGKHITWRRTFEYNNEGAPTQEVSQVLGIVGDDYQIIQNRQALELAVQLAGAAPGDPAVDCAGVLNDGQRFFVTIPLPDLVVDPNGVKDGYSRNLVIVTGHNGRQAFEAVNGFTRAVCANTVAAALSQKNHKFKIRHVGDVDVSMSEAKRLLGIALSADEEFVEIAQSLLDKKAAWSMVEQVADKLWPKPEDPNERQELNHQKRIDRLNEIWLSDRASDSYGTNRYSVFQTITEYMEHDQHIVGESNRYNRAERAVRSPGFNNRVHKLARALQTKSPAKAL